MRLHVFEATAVLAVGLVGVGQAAERCSSDDCLRAVEKIGPASRNGTTDCLSFFRTTVTPATRTVFSTTVGSSTLTGNTDLARSSTSTVIVAPSQLWSDQHHVLDILRNGANHLEGRQVTVTPTSLPNYAILCSNIAAFSSACSCLGLSQVTSTAPIPFTTQLVTVSPMSTFDGSSTILPGFFTTLPNENAASPITDSLPLGTRQRAGDAVSTLLGRDPSVASELAARTATTSSEPLKASTTTTGSHGAVLNGATQPLDATGTGPLLNTLLRETNSDAVFDTTTSTSVNVSRTAPYHNVTTSALVFSGDCTGIYRNATACSRYVNSTSSGSGTRTIDKTCGQTAAPFAVQVAQPGGLFDKWYLRLSGDGVLFTASADASSQFSVEASGHLCAVGHPGDKGNAAIAIVETLNTAGGAVWFVDANSTAVLEPRGYASLECQAGTTLTCMEGVLKNWIGCGLQLDMTSDSGSTVVVDKLNCTALSLSPLYSSTTAPAP